MCIAILNAKGVLSLKTFIVFSDNVILLDFSEVALLGLFTFEPLIRSLLGAGVCDADLRPLLFMRKILSKINFFILKNSIFVKIKLIIMEFLNIKSPKFLGGQNVHNLIKIGLASFIVYKLVKK